VSALPRADRQRLGKLLGLISSTYDGESLAAARAADRFVRSLGLTWGDVLDPPGEHAANRNHVTPWRQQAGACLAQPGSLRPWEIGFLRNILASTKLSPKQRSVLDQIAGRVLRRAAA
jgi:hypothetical protein